MAQNRSYLTLTLIAIVGFLTVCPVVMLVFGSFSTGLGAFGQIHPGQIHSGLYQPGVDRNHLEHHCVCHGFIHRCHGSGIVSGLP